jgi:PTS system mannose-specific IIA component
LVKLAKCRENSVSDAIAQAIDAGHKYMDCLPEYK